MLFVVYMISNLLMRISIYYFNLVVLETYISLSNNNNIPYNEDYSLSFDITKEDYEIFSIFDELYR